MDTQNELDIITRIRGEVTARKELTGENLFLAWGYPTAIVMFMEFVALMVWNEDWCSWIWAGIPLIGVPLMIYFVNEDYERTHHRTLDQNVIMMMWVFIGFACCVGGFAFTSGRRPSVALLLRRSPPCLSSFRATSGRGSCSSPPSSSSSPSSSRDICSVDMLGIVTRINNEYL